MLAAETHERRALLDRARRLAGGPNRYADFAFALRVRDAPEHPLIGVGGRLDTVTREFVGEPEEYPTWEIGAGQLPPLEAHAGRFVCVGAQGAGKTEVLAIAILARAVTRGRNRAIGVIAPTAKRLRIIWEKLTRRIPPRWILHARLESEITLLNGCRLQFVAAKAYSAEIGSPVQGYSFSAGAFIDEEQDVDDEGLADVLARLRGDDPDPLCLSSCTLKDTPAWRSRKQRYDADPTTTVYRMEATANPFVAPSYWEMLRARLTERQYRMRVLALDARPELAVYPEFNREHHVRPVPQLGARDVTRVVTGRPFLIGHDPGKIHDVSLILRAFQMQGETLPTWWVVDEITTEQSSTEEHILRVSERLRAVDASPGDALVVADPYGNRSDDTTPDVTVYKQWINRGYKIRPAAYAKGARGAGGRPGYVPREAGIELVNSLLRNAEGATRLYIGASEQSTPLAPRLVGALEMSERDASGKAEHERKTKADQSHWPASLRYALWPWEKVRIAAPAWRERLSDGHP